MNRSPLPAALMTLLLLAACGQKADETIATEPFAAQAPANPQTPAAAMSAMTSLPADHPSVNTSRMAQPAALPPLTQKAEVLNAINVTQYTYLEVNQDNKTRWLATTTTTAKKGDIIRFDDGTVMNNFESKMLNRTFPSITFVGRVEISGGKS
jgi:hypothetical protein